MSCAPMLCRQLARWGDRCVCLGAGPKGDASRTASPSLVQPLDALERSHGEHSLLRYCQCTSLELRPQSLLWSSSRGSELTLFQLTLCQPHVPFHALPFLPLLPALHPPPGLCREHRRCQGRTGAPRRPRGSSSVPFSFEPCFRICVSRCRRIIPHPPLIGRSGDSCERGCCRAWRFPWTISVWRQGEGHRGDAGAQGAVPHGASTRRKGVPPTPPTEAVTHAVCCLQVHARDSRSSLATPSVLCSFSCWPPFISQEPPTHSVPCFFVSRPSPLLLSACTLFVYCVPCICIHQSEMHLTSFLGLVVTIQMGGSVVNGRIQGRLEVSRAFGDRLFKKVRSGEEGWRGRGGRGGSALGSRQ